MSRDILENISALLAEGKLADLREQLCDMNVVDIAQAMESLPEDELLRIFLIRREQLSCRRTFFLILSLFLRRSC